MENKFFNMDNWVVLPFGETFWIEDSVYILYFFLNLHNVMSCKGVHRTPNMLPTIPPGSDDTVTQHPRRRWPLARNAWSFGRQKLDVLWLLLFTCIAFVACKIRKVMQHGSYQTLGSYMKHRTYIYIIIYHYPAGHRWQAQRPVAEMRETSVIWRCKSKNGQSGPSLMAKKGAGWQSPTWLMFANTQRYLAANNNCHANQTCLVCPKPNPDYWRQFRLQYPSLYKSSWVMVSSFHFHPPKIIIAMGDFQHTWLARPGLWSIPPGNGHLPGILIRRNPVHGEDEAKFGDCWNVR